MITIRVALLRLDGRVHEGLVSAWLEDGHVVPQSPVDFPEVGGLRVRFERVRGRTLRGLPVMLEVDTYTKTC